MDNNLELEIARLHAAVDLFAVDMKAKLEWKARQGWAGWDNPENEMHIGEFLLEHINRGFGQEVDIANLCMMLHWHRDPDFKNRAMRKAEIA